MADKLLVYTSQYRYSGDDRLDVTTKSTDPIGIVFAPSRSLLAEFLPQKQAAKAKGGSWPWDDYQKFYLEEMRTSYRRNTPKWEQLLQRKRVTLVCFCSDQQCHRVVLAQILAQCGAINMNEVRPEFTR